MIKVESLTAGNMLQEV